MASEAREVTPGVWHWCIHDDRIDYVSDAYAVAVDEGIVLIDPLPLAEQPLRVGAVAAICLTCGSHQRSAWRYRRDLGAPVYAPAVAREIDEEPDKRYGDSDLLPGVCAPSSRLAPARRSTRSCAREAGCRLLPRPAGAPGRRGRARPGRGVRLRAGTTKHREAARAAVLAPLSNARGHRLRGAEGGDPGSPESVASRGCRPAVTARCSSSDHGFRSSYGTGRRGSSAGARRSRTRSLSRRSRPSLLGVLDRGLFLARRRIERDVPRGTRVAGHAVLFDL
jgi:hypothetical protein